MHVVIAVTLEAPAHAERFLQFDNLHLRDVAVAALTADARAEMHAVIEVREVRHFMDADPVHRCFIVPAFTKSGELGAGGLCEKVAIHAGLRRGNHGHGRFLHAGVAVSAIHAEGADVKLVTVRNRLNRSVAYVRVPRRKIVPDESDGSQYENNATYTEVQRDVVGPFGE
jgi:hypothetical protein